MRDARSKPVPLGCYVTPLIIVALSWVAKYYFDVWYIHRIMESAP